MENSFNLQSLQESLSKAKTTLVVLPVQPSLDGVAAGLALFLSLKKQGKQTVIGCSTQMTVAFNRLFAVDKITDKIGSKNLIVSFDYTKDSIERVSYNIEGNKFNLVIEPKEGCLPLDPEKVSYSYSGANAEIIFAVGATKLEDFGKLYFNEKKIFDEKLIVNIDNKPTNTRFGQVNIYNPQAASISELVVELIKLLNLQVNQDIATNLLVGIEANTSNFAALNVSPATFEAAAWCLKNGAKRRHLAVPQPVSKPPAFVQPQPVVQPQPTFQKQPTKKPLIGKKKTPPPDWFKPKIYKSNTLV